MINMQRPTMQISMNNVNKAYAHHFIAAAIYLLNTEQIKPCTCQFLSQNILFTSFWLRH